jgi:hypothetical protein
MEFVSVEVSCETRKCPNYGIPANTILLLTEGKELPWYVCGVCQVDLIPNPRVEDETSE